MIRKLGFRGRFSTKTRRCSITLGASATPATPGALSRPAPTADDLAPAQRLIRRRTPTHALTDFVPTSLEQDAA
jgi:hypothetical protein